MDLPHFVTGFNGAVFSCSCDRGHDHDAAQDSADWWAALQTAPVDPDCRDGKHHACRGQTYAETPQGDLLEVPCTCPCHREEP